MMKKILIILLLVPFITEAQESGIHFDGSLNWKEIQAKAAVENKYIFIDCYTTWCGPCKYMNDSIFSRAAVGEYFNAHFINIRIQLDTNKKDDEFIKNWYVFADEIKERYQINLFPTYLFFAPDGHIVHRVAGATEDPNQFIAKAKEALISDKQYYTMLNQYLNGKKDSVVLKQLAIQSHDFGDDDMTERLVKDYLHVLSNVFTKENLQFIGQLTKRSTGQGFDLYLHHAHSVDSILGKYHAERKVMNIIMDEDTNIVAVNQKAVEGLDFVGTINGQAQYSKDPNKHLLDQPDPNWKSIYTGIEKKYGAYYADRIVKWIKIYYYNQREKWPAYIKSVLSYVGSYKDDVTRSQLNAYAWDVFVHSEDQHELSTALQWSREIFDASKDAVNRHELADTYANLLYKTGQKQEAISYEEMAVQLAPGDDKVICEKTLAKMKKGEKTWD